MVPFMEVKAQQEKLIDRGMMVRSVSVTSRGPIEVHMEMSSR